MVKIKQPVEFTGYIMCKCKCGHISRVDVGKYAYKGYASDGKTILDFHKFIINCTKCSRVLRVDLGYGLYGKYIETVVCNSKCTGATGHNCECSCGGKNHGSNWDIKGGVNGNTDI